MERVAATVIGAAWTFQTQSQPPLVVRAAEVSGEAEGGGDAVASLLDNVDNEDLFDEEDDQC